MRVQKSLGLVAAATGLLLAAVSPAEAAYGASANTCVPASSTDAARLAYNGAGVRNPSASQATVQCFVGSSNTAATTELTVFLVDNHPGAAIACTATATSYTTGSQAWTLTKVSGPGTTAISFTVPVLVGGSRALGVQCTIPALSGANPSYIFSVHSG